MSHQTRADLELRFDAEIPPHLLRALNSTPAVEPYAAQVERLTSERDSWAAECKKYAEEIDLARSKGNTLYMDLWTRKFMHASEMHDAADDQLRAVLGVEVPVSVHAQAAE